MPKFSGFAHLTSGRLEVGGQESLKVKLMPPGLNILKHYYMYWALQGHTNTICAKTFQGLGPKIP